MTLTSNPASSSRRNGCQILMPQLRTHGVRRLFMVPGESYLPCIDALNEHKGAIDPIVCRQESGAAYMAEAYGKLTGEPGIYFVTRGPGATNASIGVHTAFQDSTPMILFVGQVGNDFCEREAFQEIDYRRMFGQIGDDRQSHRHPSYRWQIRQLWRRARSCHAACRRPPRAHPETGAITSSPGSSTAPRRTCLSCVRKSSAWFLPRRVSTRRKAPFIWSTTQSMIMVQVCGLVQDQGHSRHAHQR